MPPFSSSRFVPSYPLFLLLLALSLEWRCMCQEQVLTVSDASLSPPANPLRDPQVRKALIRALARSLQRLGDTEEVTSGLRVTEGGPHTFDLSSTPPPFSDHFDRSTPSFSTSQDDFLSDKILNEVDKHIRNGDIHRVPPEEVHVTSKVAPRPFTLEPRANGIIDSLSSSAEDAGVPENNLEEVSSIPPAREDVRIEQHEIQSVKVTDEARRPPIEKKPSSGNTVDIYRAPLIAAFTVHQDYFTGATKGVVPLLPPTEISPSSSATRGNQPFPLPNDELQDLVRQITNHPSSSPKERFPNFNGDQVRQQQQSNEQQQNHLVRLQGPPQSIDPNSIRNFQATPTTEQQLIEQRLRRIRQLQELRLLQTRLQHLQQQFQSGL